MRSVDEDDDDVVQVKDSAARRPVTLNSDSTTDLRYMEVYCVAILRVPRSPLTSTWPHLNCDVGLEEGEY